MQLETFQEATLNSNGNLVYKDPSGNLRSIETDISGSLFYGTTLPWGSDHNSIDPKKIVADAGSTDAIKFIQLHEDAHSLDMALNGYLKARFHGEEVPNQLLDCLSH